MLRFASMFLALAIAASTAHADPVSLATICSGVTATGAQASVPVPKGPHTFQGWLTTTSGSGTSTVVIEGTLDGTAWSTVVTLTPGTAGPDVQPDSGSRFTAYRCNASALSGTGAAYTVKAGY